MRERKTRFDPRFVVASGRDLPTASARRLDQAAKSGAETPRWKARRSSDGGSFPVTIEQQAWAWPRWCV